MKTFVVAVDWTDIKDAALILNIPKENFYRAIKRAKDFPQSSPFKRGISWRAISEARYQVNVENWEKALEKI
jgi:hypothetical protein